MADTQVNTNSSATIANFTEGLAPLADGGHRVFWAGAGADGTSDIFSRRFDLNGQPSGPAEVVNANTVGRQANASVISLASGGHVVEWSSQPSSSGPLEYWLKVFDENGSAVGSDFKIVGARNFVFLEKLESGGFVFAYRTAQASDGIFINRYSDTGLLSSQQTILPLPTGQLTAASLKNGDFVTFQNVGTTYKTTHFTVTADSITPSSLPSVINQFTNSHPFGGPAIATGLADGGYVVTWTHRTLETFDDIYMRRFNAWGEPLSGEVRVNSEIAHPQYSSQVTALADGGFFVVWINITPDATRGNDVRGQRFDAAGGKIGSEINVTETTVGTQIFQQVSLAGDGSLIVAWATGTGAPADIAQTHFDMTDGDGGANTLLGSPSILRDLMYGMSGNDMLFGFGGADVLDGGEGDDILVGGPGADVLDGAVGNDTASYAGYDKGVDVSLAISGPQVGTEDTLISIENLIGGAFADTLTGDSGANILRGMAGADKLQGGGGRDTLDGGAGSDWLIGGEGADAFIFRASDGKSADRIVGFNADDVLLTDVKIFDGNGDGIITFGGNKKLELAGGNTVTITDPDNRTVQRLEFDGVFHDAATGGDYFVYSLFGSPAGVHTLSDALAA